MVTVITSTKREHLLKQISSYYIQQTVPNKEWIIVLNNNSINLVKWQQYFEQNNDIHVFQLDETKTLGECLNFAAAKARYNRIAKWDDDDYYSPFYLVNSLQDLEKTGAEITGKAALYIYFKYDQLLTLFRPEMCRRFLKNNRGYVAGATLVFQKKVWEQVPFRALNVGEDVCFQQDCIKRGIKRYSGSYEDFVAIRYSREHQHTWRVDEKEFKKQCKIVAVTDTFEEYVWKGGSNW